MTRADDPAPESCLHNLHRAAADGRTPEATNLCRNQLGTFHMLDCPLFLGRACTYFEAAPEPHPLSSDDDVEDAADDLKLDFLSWQYTARVRALRQPEGAVPPLLTVESIPEPDEDVRLVLRAAAPAEGEAVPGDAPPEAGDAPPAPPVEAPVEEAAAAEPPPEPEPRRPELYPGQRRSEDRASRRRRMREASRRKAPEHVCEDPAHQHAEESAQPAEDAAPVPERRRTVDELLDALPGAELPERREDRGDGQRGARPRARRPRRGRGGGGGGGGGAAGVPSEAPAGRAAGGPEDAPGEPRRARPRRRRRRPSGGTPPA